MRTLPVDQDKLLRTFVEMVADDSATGHEAEIGDLLGARLLDSYAKGILSVALSTGWVDDSATSEHIVIEGLGTGPRILPAVVTQPPLLEKEP